MPEHLRALVIILFLAGAAFAFARPLACAAAMKDEDFLRRRNLWFALTLAAFLAHDFWIFIAFAAALLIFAVAHERNRLALFYFVLFAAPAMAAQIPGFGLMEHFFTMNYLRLLALVVLLPAFLSLRERPDVEPFGRSVPDKLLAGYLVLQFLLQLTHLTFTNTLRSGVFYAFIDVFLPYYVASRQPRNLQGFREALMAFAVAALVLAAIAIFEFAKRWLLYMPLEDALGVGWGLRIYLDRGAHLRAQASTGQPIPLGYVMAVAIGLFLFLRSSIPNPMARRLGMALLVGGLIAALSRGPWVGAAATLLVWLATGPAMLKRLVTVAFVGTIAVPVLLVAPAGQTIIDYLPFVGTVDEGSVIYRQLIVEVSMEVIRQSPWFGVPDALQLPVMQQLRQGQGIIDIVNTYLGVALDSGVVGLSLFAAFFAAAVAGIAKGMFSLPDRNHELYRLGQALLATLVGVLIIIYTVSSISVIPVVYWSIAGLGVAYARMLARAPVPQAAPRASFEPATGAPRT